MSIIRPIIRPIISPIIGSERSVLDLFAGGVQGAIYDISDLSTLFQDDAGATPVTATGQSVGRVLDLSGNGNHLTQSVVGSRPIYRDVGGLKYLEFDGTDDFLVTSAVDFTATDSMTFIAGVQFERANTGSTAGAIIELSNNPASINGTVRLVQAANAARIFIGSRGTVDSGHSPVDVLSGQGTKSVNTVQADISDPVVMLRQNGALIQSFNNNQGTGNYGNHPIYIGRRGGASLPFDGFLFSAIIRGATTSESDLDLAESFVADRSGVIL